QTSASERAREPTTRLRMTVSISTAVTPNRRCVRLALPCIGEPNCSRHPYSITHPKGHRMRRSALFVPALVALTLMATACTSAQATPAAPTPENSDAGWPRKVDHAMGSTVIDEPP